MRYQAPRRVVQHWVPVSERIGYARVSTFDQSLDLQSDALTAAGCTRIFTEHASGTRTDRPQLDDLFTHLRVGDTLVVWRLDRLGRSLPHLLSLVAELQQRRVGLISVTEAIDTTTAGGRLVFNIFGALAEFERALVVERTQAGLAAARARGRTGGRPPKLTAAKLAQAKRMLASEMTHTAVAEVLGISRVTLYRHLTTTDNTGH